MDKYEYKIRAEEIKTLISQKKYVEAAKVADTIDWTRVKSVMMLCTVSDVYKVNRRFEDAKLLLEMANERHPSGRMILYSLCDLAIRMGDVVHAIEYYKDFVQVAPNDSGRYVLQYKLYEAQDVGLEERIAVLEELKKKDYREKWAYELAYLYHRVGLATKCVEECDELILWFGEGKYVMKAMELKTLHQPLSPSQQRKFDAYMMRRQGLRVPEEAEQEPAGKQQSKAAKGRASGQEMDIQVKTMDVGKYNTINLQKELAASMQELMQEGRKMAAQGRQEPEPAYPETAYAQPEYSEPAYRESEYGQPEYSEPEYPEEADVQPEYAEGQNGAAAHISEPEAEYPEREAENAQRKQAEPQGIRSARTEKKSDNTLPRGLDGQAGVMPQEHPAEKQITGQMNIEDIMREWEKMKRENEEKRRQEIRQRVQEQTGALFRDFDETSRKGVLERLQKEERIPVDRRERSRDSVISAHTKIWAAEEVQNAMKAAAAAGSQAGAREAAEQEKAARAELQAQRAGAAEPVQEETRAAVQEPVSRTVQEETEEQAAQAAQKAAEAQAAAAMQKAAEALAAAMMQKAAEVKAETEENRTGASRGAAGTETAEPAAEEQKTSGPEEAAAESAERKEAGTETAEGKSAEADQAGPEPEAAVPAGKEPEAVLEPSEPDTEPEEDRTSSEAGAAAQVPAGTDAGRRQEPEAKEKDSAEEPKEEQSGKQAAGKQAAGKQKADKAEGDRSLTGAEKRLFASFVPTKGAMKRLVSALDQISLTACTGNLIITGEPGSDTLELAKNVVKDLKAKEPGFSGRVAKITGSALNSSKKQPAELVEKLAGGALMIEKAGEISEACAQKLLEGLNQEKWGILVILMDTRRRIRKLLEDNPQMASFFNARFDVEALDNSTLVAYGCQYARMQEYAIDELGRLALHTRIEDMQTSDHIVTVKDVREIVDEAINHAERKTPKHLMDVLLSRRYDDNDMIILHEGDFI